MIVSIENQTAELISSAPAMVRIRCDVINTGEPGKVTIRGAVSQNGKEKDSCDTEIHLLGDETKEVFFDLEIDPSLGLEYTYEFEAKNEKPD